jgi:hypothetical protein
MANAPGVPLVQLAHRLAGIRAHRERRNVNDAPLGLCRPSRLAYELSRTGTAKRHAGCSAGSAR